MQDPRNEDEAVILIHSLVEGGTAERDHQLRVFDRLVHVNHVQVANQPLDYAVNLLISIPLNSLAVIGINHPVPVVFAEAFVGQASLPSLDSVSNEEEELEEGEEELEEGEEECGPLLEDEPQNAMVKGTQEVRKDLGGKMGEGGGGGGRR